MGVASGTHQSGAGRGARDLGRVGGGVGEADTGDPDRRRREAALCPVTCEPCVCVCQSPSDASSCDARAVAAHEFWGVLQKTYFLHVEMP